MTVRPWATAPQRRRPSARFVLLMLMAAYMLNFIDRTIIGSLAEPIKTELELSDAQVGLMSGLAFSIFYCTLGIPIARLAETRDRVTIISVAIAVWSAMTALCGLAQNFAQLFLARVGVGVGEAGCTPPAHSLIADYFPPERRATAYGIYSLGIPLGALFGAVAGGWIAHHFGWRAAFMIVGLPGILLALLIRLTIADPGRAAPERQAPSLAAVVGHFWGTRRLRYILIANTISGFVGFGMVVFAIPFLLRGTDLNLFQAALGYGVIYGLASFAGTSLGGVVTDRIAARTGRDRLIVPGFGMLAAAPLYIAAVYSASLPTVAMLVVAATILRDLHIGPALGAVQNGFPARMRARAAAVLLLAMNLIGLGLGPLLIGWASDHFAARSLGAGFARCAAGAEGHGAPIADAACRAASFTGLQLAFAIAFALYAVAGLFFLLATREPASDNEETE
ncbi:MFS transporter [Sphingopyxis sp.]|uniref:spinster family MFS transporter n=1 Tax=Sphingopyxis sp. TaxID=1908224 RepID=UPI0026304960|nr:MFS transporter [Sphingopyxis sp.]MCW0199421.1 MFS transporter [Sphingopyxis sp.]